MGPVFTIMRNLPSKNGQFSSYSDRKIEDNINDTTLKAILNDNNTIQDNRGKSLDN